MNKLEQSEKSVYKSVWSAKPTFHQSVFVSRRGTSQNTQFGPDFVQSLLFNLEGAEKQEVIMLLLNLKLAVYHKTIKMDLREQV